MSNINKWTFPDDENNDYVEGMENSCYVFATAEDIDFQLTDEENENLCRAFNLLDVDGDGVIELPELEFLLVSLGRLPFDDDLVEILPYAGAQGCENATGMDYKGFRDYLINQLKYTENEDELRKAFEIFDKDPPSGKINVKELRQTLKTVGSQLTDDEIDFLYKAEDYWMLDEKDMIGSDKLIDKLMGRQCNCKFLNC